MLHSGADHISAEWAAATVVSYVTAVEAASDSVDAETAVRATTASAQTKLIDGSLLNPLFEYFL